MKKYYGRIGKIYVYWILLLLAVATVSYVYQKHKEGKI